MSKGVIRYVSGSRAILTDVPVLKRAALIVPGGFAQHGIGGAKDLPISPELAIAGAVAALAVSFGVLALAWREPRYDGHRVGRPAPGWLSSLTASPGWHVAMRAIGLLFFGFGAFAAVFGQDLLTNPIFGMFYVWWWVGLPVASLLLGPVWRAVSPVRTVNAFVARISGGDPDRGVFTYSPRVGYWPAASACSPSSGSSWSTSTAPSSARSGCGARCTSPRC